MVEWFVASRTSTMQRMHIGADYELYKHKHFYIEHRTTVVFATQSLLRHGIIALGGACALFWNRCVSPNV